MNVTGQGLILRFVAIAFYIASWFVFNRSLPAGMVLFGVGVVLSILGRRRSRRSELRLNEQQKKKAFVIIVGASIVGYVGTPVVLYWYDPRTDVRMLMLISVVLLALTIGYYYWWVFKKEAR